MRNFLLAVVLIVGAFASFAWFLGFGKEWLLIVWPASGLALGLARHS